jgi:hypothetical protein
MTAFCNFSKDEVIEKFAADFMNVDLTEAHNSLSLWESCFPEDTPTVGVCHSLVYILEGTSDHARECFENNFPNLSNDSTWLIPLQTIENIFYYCLEDIEEAAVESVAFHKVSAKILLCKEKSRLWKFKAITGMLITAAGCVVAPFNPPLGVGINVWSPHDHPGH